MSDQKSDSCLSTYRRVVRFTHKWTISSNQFYEKGIFHKIVSPTFSPPQEPGLKFSFCLFPSASSLRDCDHMSVVLYLDSADQPEPTKVHCKLSVLDAQNRKQCTKSLYPKLEPKKTWYKFYRFIAQEDLHNLSSLLLVEKLALFLEIEVELDTPSGKMKRKMDTQIESQVLKNLGDLFKSRKLSDVVLVAGDLVKTEHRAHRAILAARSSVFGAMFEHDTKESNDGRVLIDDFEGEVIEEMLRFIYTGKVLKLDELADRLLIAADKYGLDLLKDICENSLAANLKTENVLTMLVIADRHSSPLLRSKSIEYINANLPSLVETDNWQAIKDKPELYFELFSKVITENHVKVEQQPTLTKFIIWFISALIPIIICIILFNFPRLH